MGPIGAKITVRGTIVDPDQKNKDKPKREIVVNDKAQLYKLPLAVYPLTHRIGPDGKPQRICPEGLPTVLISGEGECPASFHRFEKGARGGEGIYIGTATRRLNNGRHYAQQFREFPQKAGPFAPGTEVQLDFQKDAGVIQVHISKG